MILKPSFDQFEKGYLRGENQVVYTRIAADIDTPVSLMMRLTDAGENSFMLESVTGGEVRGRYSIIGMRPDVLWKCEGTQSSINRNRLNGGHHYAPQSGDPLDNLNALIKESYIDLPDDLPAAAAGLFGYLGYDMIRLRENLPHINPDVLGAADALFMRPSLVAVLDGVKSEVILVAPVWAGGQADALSAYDAAQQTIQGALDVLEKKAPVAGRYLPNNMAANAPAPVSNFTKTAYLQAVEKAKEYIRAGDIFQVVPAQRWVQDFTAPPFTLYRALRRTNPSPYMFFFNFGAYQIVGASPEILVQLKGKQITLRPIAGTRPRGLTPEQDKALERDLLADEKERAEHLMLLDLGRNDVGRVAKSGTVRPTERFIVEHYSHVMHIVSNVVGEIAEDKNALEALLAGTPAGTLSGAPKVRAMEIIDELEPEKRGIYGGGCGYFSAGGDMDICIALRTAIIKDKKLYTQAGGGVVYDSNPEAEYEETVNKAKAIWAAAAQASGLHENNL